MNEFNDTRVTGRVTQTEAATADDHLIRKGEVDALVSGTSSAGHTHVAADVTNFTAAEGIALHANLVNSSSMAWLYNGTTQQTSGTVVVKSNNPLRSDGGGLFVKTGAASNEAAAGDHTHSGLHNALTKEDTATIALTLNDQLLAADVILAPLGGLLEQPSGVAVNFGTGNNNAARGDHTHAQLHEPVTVQSTTTVILGVTGQLLSGTTRLDPNPGAGKAALSSGVGGIYLNLGTGANQASAGNHGHTAATESSDGFMSAADKTKLDNFAMPSGVQVVSTDTLHLDIDSRQILSGSVRLNPNPGAGKAPLSSDFNGIYLQLGTGANQAAAGNHTHASTTPSGTGFIHVTGGAQDSGAKLVFNADVAVTSGIVESKLALNFPTHSNASPTGTGFRHVTGGTEDSAAKLAVNADVGSAAGIVESKLALNFPTHSNANDPTALQKLALGGTGTPGGSNPFVTKDSITQDVIQIVLDGYGLAIPTGIKGYYVMPYSATVTGWDLVGDQSGSMVVDVYRNTYANFPPTSADTIAGSEKPTLTAQQINQDLTLTTWTPLLTEGDVLAFNVDSNDVIQRAELHLRITRL